MSFTIGTDVELICRRNGQFVPAHNYFKSNSSFGLDGCDSVAEIRPGYSESPIDLTAKIYQVLEYGHEKYPDLEFFSGHCVNERPIGGHTHFSLNPDSKIIEGLDIVLGAFSNCVDDKIQKAKRARTGYGAKSAYRRQPHGFEYRTPGSFLLSPSITLIHFTLAKLAVIGVQEDNIDFADLKGTQHSCTFLKKLKQLPTIPEDCREGLKELDSLIGKKVNWNQDILPNWGLRRAA